MNNESRQQELAAFLLGCISSIIARAQEIGITYDLPHGIGKKTVLCLSQDDESPSVIKGTDRHGGVDCIYYGRPFFLTVVDYKGLLFVESDPDNMEIRLDDLEPWALASLADYVGSMTPEQADKARHHVIDAFPEELSDIPVEISFEMNGRTVRETILREDIDFSDDNHWWLSLKITEGLPENGLYELTGETDAYGFPRLNGMTIIAYDKNRDCIRDDIKVNW